MQDDAGELYASALDALSDALERHYPLDVLRGFERVDTELADDPDSLVESLARAVASAALAPKHFARLADHKAVLETLVTLAASSVPVRGEQARREAVLAGLGDVALGLETLVAAGVLVMIPAPGQRDFDLSDELGARRYLHRELLLPKKVMAWIRTVVDLDLGEERSIGSPDREVESDDAPTLHTVEMNLLHLSSLLNGDAMLLNKDGTPNRRSLSRFVRGLVLTQSVHEHAPDLLDTLTFERVYHLFALALDLGLLRIEDRSVTADVEGCRAFFEADEASRDRQLLKAWRVSERWDAVEAVDAVRTAALSTDKRRGGLDPSPSAARFQGPRGQLLSDLRKLPLGGWAETEEVIDLLLALDRGFLVSALKGTSADEKGPGAFLYAELMCGLRWLGVAQTGVASDAPIERQRVLHFTERGGRLLGLPRAEAAQPKPPMPALMIQPNFEITVYLQAVTLSTLFTLYRVGERVKLSDRTAVFKLTGESVQKGYGQGLDAESLLTFLQANSAIPIGDNIKLQIDDWERVHRKVTLFANGVLLEYPDPDRLDLLTGTIEHYWDAKERPQRVGSTELFLPEPEAAPLPLSKAVELDAAHVIDYEEPPPPCLVHLGDLTFAPVPAGLDIVTRVEIAHIAVPLGNPDFPRAWRLDVDKINAHWGELAVTHLLSFIDMRLDEGVSSALELQLLAFIEADAHAEVQRGVTIVTVSSPQVCDILLDVPDIDECVAARLGPVTLLVSEGDEELIEETLAALGLLTTT